MTCSKRFGRLLQASCLGLIGTLTVVGCSGSSTTAVTDAAVEHITTSTDGPPPVGQVTVSSVLLNFGSVDVGATSSAQTVTVTVTGGAVALNPTVSGAGFALGSGGTCVSPQAAGTCTVAVVFAPGVIGAANGTLTFGVANSPSVSLSGSGNTPGTFTVTPPTVALGTLQVNQTAPVVVTVTPQPSVPSITCTGSADLSATPTTTCPATGAVAAACTYTFTFKAATAGAKNDTVTCTGGGKITTTPVTATVLAPAQLVVQPNPAAVSAVVGVPGTATLTVINNGGATTGALQATVASSTTPDPFAVSTDCATLAQAGVCHVTVTFSPTAAGSPTATVTVTDGTVQATATVNGVAVTSAAVAIKPNPSDFGTVTQGQSSKPTTFTVTNGGGTATTALTVTSASASFPVTSDLCTGTTLAASATCTFAVTFSPPAKGAAGATSANVTVTQAGGAIASLTVSGTAAPVSAAVLTAAPTSINFGSIPIGQSSAAQTVTITNTGTAASGVLTATALGTGAAEVTLSGNSCTAALAPQATCTVAVVFSPTDTTGVNGQINVTDGAATISVPMVGTGLTATALTTDPAGAVFTFSPTVVGYTYTATAVAMTVTAGTTVPSGAITLPITGANAADFAVVAASTTCGASLQPGQTCNIVLSFTPGGVGARAATLTVTSTAGGTFPFTLTGTGLAPVQLIALGQTATTATTPYTGLDFGQAPNATAGNVFAYRLVVRGATTPTTASTVPSVALAAGTPPDFTYVTGAAGPTWTATTTAPCTGATLALPATGTQAGWSRTTVTPTNPSLGPNALDTSLPGGTTDDQSTSGYWTCDFYVEFDPQSGQSATAKAATLTATATAGGTSSLSLSGTATGPLTITPTTEAFGTATTPIPIGQTTAATTFTVANAARNSAAQGPLTVAVSGANAADFSVVADLCSTVTLTPPGGATPSCTIGVAFSPTTAAGESATVTVTATNTGATTSATLSGVGGPAAALTATPSSATFASVAQNNTGAWTTFTISNPATASATAPINYVTATKGGLNPGVFEIATLSSAGVTAYPAGSCGNSGATTLNPGASCTIQVRLNPILNANTPVGAIGGTLTIGTSAGNLPVIALSGTVAPQLVLSGSAISTVNSVSTLAFGNVAQGIGATETFTVTNNGAAITALGAALGVGGPALPSGGFSFATTTASSACAAGTSLAAGASCQMSLTFTPTASTGAVSSPFIVNNGVKPVTDVSLTLTATMVPPPVLARYGFGDYSGSAIDLGSAPLNTSTGSLTLWFTNTGGVAATALSAGVTGADAGDFTVQPEGTCSGNLAPGATCSVTVQCTPSAAGARTATLSLATTSSGVAPVTVNLQAYGSGTSQVYVQALAGSKSSFFTYSGGAASANANTPSSGDTEYFVLNNGTTSPVAISSLVVNTGYGDPTAGEFALSTATTLPSGVTGTACPSLTTLAAGGSCVFGVKFAPAWTSITRLYRWAGVGIGGAPTNLLGLIGRVQMPPTLSLSAASTGQVTVSGTTIEFGQITTGTTPSETVTITNVGDVATTGAVGLTIAGTPTYPYAVLGTSTCGATLASQASCTVQVNSQFSAANLGSVSGLSVQATQATPASNSTVPSATWSLAADGVAQASLSSLASATSFADTVVNLAGTLAIAPQITITVTNGTSGGSSTTLQNTGVLGVTLSDTTDFVVDSSSTCLVGGAYQSLPIGSSESCNIVVDFVPASIAALSTTVTITATPGGTPAAITLTGNGTGDLGISPASATGTQQFTIKNNGGSSTGLLRASLSGANASVFAITQDACFGTAVAAGSTCTVTVTFTGTSNTTAAQVATLTVTDGTAPNTIAGSLSVGGP